MDDGAELNLSDLHETTERSRNKGRERERKAVARCVIHAFLLQHYIRSLTID